MAHPLYTDNGEAEVMISKVKIRLADGSERNIRFQEEHGENYWKVIFLEKILFTSKDVLIIEETF